MGVDFQLVLMRNKPALLPIGNNYKALTSWYQIVMILKTAI